MFLFLFFLEKEKKQKNSRRNTKSNSFLAKKNLRTTTEKIVFRTISPKPIAPLLTYDKYTQCWFN